MERNVTDINTAMLIGMHEALTPALLQQIYPAERDVIQNSSRGFFKAIMQWLSS